MVGGWVGDWVWGLGGVVDVEQAEAGWEEDPGGGLFVRGFLFIIFFFKSSGLIWLGWWAGRWAARVDDVMESRVLSGPVVQGIGEMVGNRKG